MFVRVLFAAAVLALLGGAAWAQQGPPSCDGVNAGYWAFDTDPGGADDNFGDLMKNLAQTDYDPDFTGAQDFPSENASARAAWSQRLHSIDDPDPTTQTVQGKVQACLD